MENHHQLYEKIIQNFILWAKSEENIRLAIIVGSRARTIVPADQWSDLDVVMVVKNPNTYLLNTDWLDQFGEVRISFIEDTALGHAKERRVLFDGGLDVDFSVFSMDLFQHMIKGKEVEKVIVRGVRLLLDKDGLFPKHLHKEGKLIELDTNPTQEAFDNMIQDFWYHAVLSAKKLLRGELYIAKSGIDNYMKQIILQIAKWHARVTRNMDTWHDGRFFENWVDHRVIQNLKESYAYYDQEDIIKALHASMDLFRWLAKETAAKLKFKYPTIADQYATEWIDQNLFKS